jgi:NAD(P)-dependent dehydrogenase (short-subunit alcohol dehydrogenase family)
VDYSKLVRWDGKRALVIGAGSGIGREAALALAAHGASVIVADRDLAAVESLAEAITGGAVAYELDVLAQDAVNRAVADLDPVDVLVFTPATNVRKTLLEYTLEEFDQVIALNLRASFSLVRAFGAPMASRSSGSIIGFSSIRATTVEPGQGVYAASKAGLGQLLRTAAAELGPSGVRVNAVAPGVVDTPLTGPIKAVPQWYDAYASKTALGRWAAPSEMAGAVVYLASDAASYVTGNVLTVDGGWTAIDGRFTPPM